MTGALWVGVAAIALGAAGLIDERAGTRQPVDAAELRYFPSGKFVELTSVGFDAVAADLAFLQSIQYYGRHRRDDRRYPFAPHLFDMVTELDPRFVTPYVFGALVMAEDMGRLDLAVELLERGMAERPDRWELPFEAGFLIYVRDKDDPRAAEFLTRAAGHAGVPSYVKRFAADAQRRGGSRTEALRLWREIAETAEEPGLREMARRLVDELERGSER